MSETTTDTGTANGNGAGLPAGDTETLESLKTAIAEKDSMIEAIKSAQKGSDSKNTQLQKEIEDLRKSLKDRMTEEERKTAEAEELKTTLESLKSELNNIRAESKRKDLDSLKMKVMAEKSLNLKYADFINGESEEQILESIEKFKTLHDEEVKAVKSGVMDHGDPAKGATSQGEKTMTREEFEKMSPAEKSKRMKDGYKIT